MSQAVTKKENSCRNCQNTVKENFCNVCGQSVNRGQRLNFSYLLHEIQHSVLHVDKGILYTIKELFLHPAKTIDSYIQGKRVKLFQPFPFVVVLATIYAFLAYFSDVYKPVWVLNESTREQAENMTNFVMGWVNSHYSVTMLFFLPFFALSTFLLFRKQGYNYIEHLVIHSYITGIQIIIQLLFLPFYYLFSPKWVYNFAVQIICVYNIWVLLQIFTHYSPVIRFVKVVLSIGLGFLLVVLTVSIVLVILMLLGLVPLK